MPPKKKEVEVEKPALGRFSSHLKVGIVGMPNVGKSTLYNTLTKCSIPAENYPFCTIEPNVARVNLPDERFNWLKALYKPKSEVPAFLEVVDIAGLVKGASAGAGLGNAFLSNIRAVDGIMHVCRCFEDKDIVHVEDRVDPVDDLEIITGELRQKDIDMMRGVEASLEGMKKRSGQFKKEHQEELDAVLRIIDWLEAGKDIRTGDWKHSDIYVINEHQLLTAKPCVFLCNLSEKDYARKKNKWLAKVHAWVQSHGGGTVIPFSGALEEKLVDMPEDEQKVYLSGLGENVSSALTKIIKTGFATINLIYFFTAGADEVKCWTIRKGFKAPQAAGTIHTDFERGFICAEVMAYDDLHEAGTESEVKAKGKYRQEGKNYVVKDGDVIFFKFNVTSSKK